VWVAGKLFPRMGLLGRATIGALIPMSQDLWIDPVATSPENMSWVWAKGDCLLVLGIPQSNFVGWFALIFVFAILWEQLPKWEVRWGRLKATLFFYCTVIVGEIAILAFLFPWCYALKQVLLLFGAEHGVRVPAGW
jgi:uncharacterized membrane protein